MKYSLQVFIKKYVVVIVIAALVLSVGIWTMAEGSKSSVSSNTPDSIALAFVEAIRSNDMSRAYDLTSLEVKNHHSRADFKTGVVDGDAFYYFKGSPTDVRTSINGTQAVVDFTATVHRDGQDNQASAKEMSLSLTKEDAGWRVSDFKDLNYLVL